MGGLGRLWPPEALRARLNRLLKARPTWRHPQAAQRSSSATIPTFRRYWRGSRLNSHFGDDLNVGTLAGVAGISASHLAHLFRAEIGLTVREYVTRVRVEITRDLLQHTDDTLAQIAASVGFFGASHRARLFRQLHGQRPNACRRLARA